MTAVVARHGVFDMQVCVPKNWTDAQVLEFAEKETPSGTNGWSIRKEGSETLHGARERVPCSANDAYVHIMLDA